MLLGGRDAKGALECEDPPGARAGEWSRVRSLGPKGPVRVHIARAGTGWRVNAWTDAPHGVIVTAAGPTRARAMAELAIGGWVDRFGMTRTPSPLSDQRGGGRAS